MPAYKGASVFILEKGMPGFTVGKKESKLGIRCSDTCELIFDEVEVPWRIVLAKKVRVFTS